MKSDKPNREPRRATNLTNGKKYSETSQISNSSDKINPLKSNSGSTSQTTRLSTWSNVQKTSTVGLSKSVASDERSTAYTGRTKSHAGKLSRSKTVVIVDDKPETRYFDAQPGDYGSDEEERAPKRSTLFSIGNIRNTIAMSLAGHFGSKPQKDLAEFEPTEKTGDRDSYDKEKAPKGNKLFSIGNIRKTLALPFAGHLLGTKPQIDLAEFEPAEQPETSKEVAISEGDTEADTKADSAESDEFHSYDSEKFQKNLFSMALIRLKKRMSFHNLGSRLRMRAPIHAHDSVKVVMGYVDQPKHLYIAACIISLNCILFGYTLAISTNLSSRFPTKSITFVASSIACFGSVMLLDQVGRKYTMFLCSFFPILGTIVISIFDSYMAYLLVMVGLSTSSNIAGSAALIYLVEISDAHSRGSVVTIFMMGIYIGFFLSSVISALSYSHEEVFRWRLYIAFSVLIGILPMTFISVIPDSPQYRMMKGDAISARNILFHLRTNHIHAQRELSLMSFVISVNRVLFRGNILKHILYTPATRKSFLQSIVLLAFAMLCNPHAPFYSRIFLLHTPRGIRNIEMLVTFIEFTVLGLSFWITDLIGRRSTLLIGFFGMLISLLVLNVNLFEERKFSTSASRPYADHIDDCNDFTNCWECINNELCGFCFKKKDNVEIGGSCVKIISTKYKDQGQQSNCFNETTIRFQTSHTHCTSNQITISLMSFIALRVFYSLGISRSVFTFISEIPPQWARTLFVSMVIAGQPFGLLFDINAQQFTTYVAVVLCCNIAVAMIFVYLLIPETSNRALLYADVLWMPDTLKKKMNEHLFTDHRASGESSKYL